MGLGKSIREGSCQKPASCLRGRVPRGVFKPQRGNLPVGKVEQERDREICKDPERDGVTFTCMSHPQPSRLQRRRGRTQSFGHGIAAEKKTVLPENSSPASLAHARKESNIKHFGSHSKPVKSMGITFWISLRFGPSPFKTSSE